MSISTTSADATTVGTGTSPSATGTSTQAGQTTPAETTTTATEKTFTQAELDRVVQQRLAEEKDRAKKAVQKDKEAADEAARLKAGEFETLATERGAKVTTLEQQVETLTAQLKTYQDAIAAQLTERVKALPEELRALDPDGDPVARLAWLVKAEAAAKKLAPTATTTTVTTGTPRGAASIATSSGSNATAAEVEARKRRDYGGF